MTPAEQIAALQAEINAAWSVIRAANTKLDAFRIKCPTCRCRILPGAECSCCASVADVEPLL